MLGAIAGGLIGGLGSMATSAMNMREAEKNRDWQKMMSDTAHQREVTDLRAAGLNPILSAGGSGASTGSGATASMSDLGSAMQSGASTGMQVKQQKQAIDIQKPQVTTARNQNEVLTGDFGKAYTKFEMLTRAGADPKVAGALAGLDEIRTRPEHVKTTAKEIGSMAVNRLKGEAKSMYNYSGAKSTVDWLKKPSTRKRSQSEINRRKRTK